MFAQIEKIFGEWKASTPRAAEISGAAAQCRAQSASGPFAGQRADPDVLVGNLGITRRDPDWMRLVLANSIYGGAFHSRLVHEYSRAEGLHLQPAQRHAIAAPARIISPCTPRCATTWWRHRSPRFSTKWIACARCPFADEELESARSYLTGVFSLGVATQDGVLGQLSTVYLERLPEDYLETYRARIHALTAADVIARGAAPLRFGERADRGGRRPGPNRRAGRALRRSDRIRRSRQLSNSLLPEQRMRLRLEKQIRHARRNSSLAAAVLCFVVFARA